MLLLRLPCLQGSLTDLGSLCGTGLLHRGPRQSSQNVKYRFIHVREIFDIFVFVDRPDIAIGFTDRERDRVGVLYWEAFREKLRPAFVNDAAGLRTVQRSLRSDRMLVARVDGCVSGVCGFYENRTGAADMTWQSVRSVLPRGQAIWAVLVLSVLARSEGDGILVLDGICVDPTLQGSGIGSALLDAATEHARDRNLTAVRLSVITDNPRAEALYRRRGFAAVDSRSIGWLRHLYGFNRYIVMDKKVR